MLLSSFFADLFVILQQVSPMAVNGKDFLILDAGEDGMDYRNIYQNKQQYDEHR